MKQFIKKNILLIGIITAVYFLYSSVFLKPHKINSFSLVDDGQVLVQSWSYLKDCVQKKDCSVFVDQTFEFGVSRFRPAYWLINNTIYSFFGDNAQAHHIFRVFATGYATVFLLALILRDLGINSLFTLLGTILFFTNYYFTENVIRLGTNEPYQVIFLAIFSYLYLNRKKSQKKSSKSFIFLTLLLVWTILIKESNIAIIPTLLLFEWYFSGNKIPKKTMMMFSIPAIILLLGIVYSKTLLTQISLDIPIYASNYMISPLSMLRNLMFHTKLLLNSLSPFLKLSIVIIFAIFMLRKKIKNILKAPKLSYWLIFTISFIGVLLPWRYVLDRYQLIVVFGLIILIMALFQEFYKYLKTRLVKKNSLLQKHIFNAVSIIVVANLFFHGFPLNLAKTINYSNWFYGFNKYEADQMQVIAKYANQELYVNGKDNINNWEFLYEIPIHLKYLFGQDTDVQRITDQIPQNGYLFSKTPFDSQVEISELADKGYEPIDQKTYSVDRIDPIKFKENFVMKPIRTVIDPPLHPDKHVYYWEIRKL